MNLQFLNINKEARKMTPSDIMKRRKPEHPFELICLRLLSQKQLLFSTFFLVLLLALESPFPGAFCADQNNSIFNGMTNGSSPKNTEASIVPIPQSAEEPSEPSKQQLPTLQVLVPLSPTAIVSTSPERAGDSESAGNNSKMPGQKLPLPTAASGGGMVQHFLPPLPPPETPPRAPALPVDPVTDELEQQLLVGGGGPADQGEGVPAPNEDTVELHGKVAVHAAPIYTPPAALPPAIEPAAPAAFQFASSSSSDANKPQADQQQASPYTFVAVPVPVPGSELPPAPAPKTGGSGSSSPIQVPASPVNKEQAFLHDGSSRPQSGGNKLPPAPPTPVASPAAPPAAPAFTFVPAPPPKPAQADGGGAGAGGLLVQLSTAPGVESGGGGSKNQGFVQSPAPARVPAPASAASSPASPAPSQSSVKASGAEKSATLASPAPAPPVVSIPSGSQASSSGNAYEQQSNNNLNNKPQQQEQASGTGAGGTTGTSALAASGAGSGGSPGPVDPTPGVASQLPQKQQQAAAEGAGAGAPNSGPEAVSGAGVDNSSLPVSATEKPPKQQQVLSQSSYVDSPAAKGGKEGGGSEGSSAAAAFGAKSVEKMGAGGSYESVGGFSSGVNLPALNPHREAHSEGKCHADKKHWRVEPQSAIANAIMFDRKSGSTCEDCLDSCIEKYQNPDSPWICRSVTYDFRWKICDLFAVSGTEYPNFLVEYEGRDYFEYKGAIPPTDKQLASEQLQQQGYGEAATTAPSVPTVETKQQCAPCPACSSDASHEQLAKGPSPTPANPYGPTAARKKVAVGAAANLLIPDDAEVSEGEGDDSNQAKSEPQIGTPKDERDKESKSDKNKKKHTERDEKEEHEKSAVEGEDEAEKSGRSTSQQRVLEVGERELPSSEQHTKELPTPEKEAQEEVPQKPDSTEPQESKHVKKALKETDDGREKEIDQGKEGADEEAEEESFSEPVVPEAPETVQPSSSPAPPSTKAASSVSKPKPSTTGIIRISDRGDEKAEKAEEKSKTGKPEKNGIPTPEASSLTSTSMATKTSKDTSNSTLAPETKAPSSPSSSNLSSPASPSSSSSTPPPSSVTTSEAPKQLNGSKTEAVSTTTVSPTETTTSPPSSQSNTSEVAVAENGEKSNKIQSELKQLMGIPEDGHKSNNKDEKKDSGRAEATESGEKTNKPSENENNKVDGKSDKKADNNKGEEGRGKSSLEIKSEEDDDGLLTTPPPLESIEISGQQGLTNFTAGSSKEEGGGGSFAGGYTLPPPLSGENGGSGAIGEGEGESEANNKNEGDEEEEFKNTSAETAPLDTGDKNEQKKQKKTQNNKKQQGKQEVTRIFSETAPTTASSSESEGGSSSPPPPPSQKTRTPGSGLTTTHDGDVDVEQHREEGGTERGSQQQFLASTERGSKKQKQHLKEGSSSGGKGVSSPKGSSGGKGKKQLPAEKTEKDADNKKDQRRLVVSSSGEEEPLPEEAPESKPTSNNKNKKSSKKTLVDNDDRDGDDHDGNADGSDPDSIPPPVVSTASQKNTPPANRRRVDGFTQDELAGGNNGTDSKGFGTVGIGPNALKKLRTSGVLKVEGAGTIDLRRPCKNPLEVARYMEFPHMQLNLDDISSSSSKKKGPKDVEFASASTVAECADACDKPTIFFCNSAQFTHLGCQLSTASANHTRSNSLFQPSSPTTYAQMSYLEKVCIDARASKDGRRLFPAVRNFILVGHVQEVANAKTLAECLVHCLTSQDQFGFHCLSAMWYPSDPDQNCLLNSESRRSQPDVFVPEDQGVQMVYFDIDENPMGTFKLPKEDKDFDVQFRDSPILPSDASSKRDGWTRWTKCENGTNEKTAEVFSMRHRYQKCGHAKDVRKCPKESAFCNHLPQLLNIQQIRPVTDAPLLSTLNVRPLKTTSSAEAQSKGTSKEAATVKEEEKTDKEGISLSLTSSAPSRRLDKFKESPGKKQRESVGKKAKAEKKPLSASKENKASDRGDQGHQKLLKEFLAEAKGVASLVKNPPPSIRRAPKKLSNDSSSTISASKIIGDSFRELAKMVLAEERRAKEEAGASGEAKRKSSPLKRQLLRRLFQQAAAAKKKSGNEDGAKETSSTLTPETMNGKPGTGGGGGSKETLCMAVRDALGRKHCPFGIKWNTQGYRVFCRQPIDCPSAQKQQPRIKQEKVLEDEEIKKRKRH